MKSIPMEMLELIANNLDIVSQVQLGMVCKQTQGVSLRAKKEVLKNATFIFDNILKNAKDACNTLTTQKSRQHICERILQNVNVSGIQTTIMNVLLMFYYQMSGNTYSHEHITNTLNKVIQNIALTEREQQIWELCQEFWLGTETHVSIIISTSASTTVILTIDIKQQVNVEILKNNLVINHNFLIEDVKGIVSFAIEHCGLKFFMEDISVSPKIHRNYNVSKTPLALDKGYHVYCHMQDIQSPLLHLVDNINNINKNK
jgi:hypothetical protein